MRALGSLYTITTAIETYRPHPGETEEEWNASTAIHRCIILKAGINPSEDPSVYDKYTPEELRGGYLWAAGMMARATLTIASWVVMDAIRQRCTCRVSGGEYDERCGTVYEDYVAYGTPTQAIRAGYPPQIDVTVPTEKVEYWLRLAQAHLNKLIEADQEPVTFPGREPNPHHGIPVPGTIPTQPRGANA